jgi:hypothetical protein
VYCFLNAISEIYEFYPRTNVQQNCIFWQCSGFSLRAFLPALSPVTVGSLDAGNKNDPCGRGRGSFVHRLPISSKKNPMKSRFCALAFAALWLSTCHAQQPGTPKSPAAKDIDPLALRVLRAATDPLKGAKTFSFRALVSRETLGSNGQIVTLFHLSEVTVQRPDKLRLQLYYNAGNAVLYTPEEKLYALIPAAKTIDAALENLEKKNVFIPIRNFLSSDPYRSLSDDLMTGYVVGQVMLFDEPVHHLAFTEPYAEWQLWVIGGEHPRVRRLEVVDKSKPGHPRMVVDFLDWNMQAQPSPDFFTFEKPSDAKQIELLKEVTGK